MPGIRAESLAHTPSSGRINPGDVIAWDGDPAGVLVFTVNAQRRENRNGDLAALVASLKNKASATRLIHKKPRKG